MQKLVTACLIIGAFFYLWTQQPLPVATSPEAMPIEPDQLIRFHVLANSDSKADQDLKRRVRDAVVTAMAPKFSKAKGLAEAKELVTQNLSAIEQIAAQEIGRAGKPYPVQAKFGSFQFPTKTYGKFTLPAGEYEAVRVVIGQGAGSNWWCVLFPPLCFIDLTHSLAANPALLANNPQDGDGTLPVGQKGTPPQTSEQGKIEIRFKSLELWERISRIF